jgi:hypothetical protein
MMTPSAPAAATAWVTTAEGMTHTCQFSKRPGSESFAFNVIFMAIHTFTDAAG